MEAVQDQAGRGFVLPKPIRDALGLLPGSRSTSHRTVLACRWCLRPDGTAGQEDGVLCSAGDIPVDDGVVFALIDAGRK